MDYFKSFGVEIGQEKYHEEAVYGIALLYTALFNDISNLLAKHALTPAKMNVLMIVKHHGKNVGISQGDIGKKLMVTASNMTRLLEKLAREGLITRGSLDTDKRVKVIRITPKGSKVLDEAWPGYTARIKELAGKLVLKDQKEISSLIQRWLGGLVN